MSALEPDQPAAAANAAPDFRQIVGRLVDWHNNLRPALRIGLTVFLFAVMTAFYTVLLIAPENYHDYLPLIAAFSPVTMAVVFITRFASKRQINELSGALLFSALVPLALNALLHVSVLIGAPDNGFGGLYKSWSLAAAVLLILVGAAFAIYRLSSGNKNDTESLLNAIPAVIGIAAAILVFKLIDPVLGPPWASHYSEAQHVVGALTTLVAIVAYYWRRRDVAAFLIWPLTAWAVCTAIGSSMPFFTEFDERRAVYEATPLVFYGFLPGIVWWAFQLFIHRKSGRLDQSDRVGISVKALYRHWERSELIGEGAIEQLPNRKDQLFNDIAYVLLSGGALYLFAFAAEHSELPIQIWAPFATGFLGIGYLALLSLFRRINRVQRLRFSAMVLAALLAIPITFLIAIALWFGLAPMMPNEGTSGILLLTLEVILWLITQHLCLRLVRDVDYSTERVRAGCLTLVGSFVAFVIFRFAMGSEALLRFNIGIPVGDAGWLMTILFLVPVYFYHYREKSAFLVWPIGAAVAGVLLRVMVTAEAHLDDISEYITIQADMNEVVLSSFFGAAAGSLGLLAKHIWYDKDPTKRARAVRVRGLFTIIHAVSPLIVLLLFLMVASSFRTNAQVIIADATTNFAQMSESVLKIKARAEKGAKRLKKASEKLIKEVTESIPDEAFQLASELRSRADVLVTQTTAATKQVATIAIDKAKATASELGDKLSEALTPEIDFGFLGKLKMPDLGIGKFFKNLIGGMIPDLNLEEMFEQAMTSLYNDVEKQFEEPIKTANAMKDSVTNFVEKHKNRLEKIKNKAIKEADDMVAEILLEKENTFKHVEALVINAITFFYQLLLFLILTTATIMGYLLWKVINGMVFMIARVRNGWTMLRYAVDVQYEKQII